MQSVHYILNSQSTHEQHRQTPKNSVTRSLYCQNCIIGKIVTCELKNPKNCLEGLIIITTYICAGCQIVTNQVIRDFTL